ncbi:hypothetical protein GGI18_005619, partial [Coemansia linderi]
MTQLLSTSEPEQRPLWTPKDVTATGTFRFKQFVNSKRGLSLETYDDLYAWSVTDIESFWADVWEFTGTVSSEQYTQILESEKAMDQIPKWFIGSKLNYAENVLQGMSDCQRVAIYSAGEGRTVDSLTFSQLYEKVRLCASAMRKAGLAPGDRVAGYIPNVAEAVVAFLAAASIGAIWSSTSTDFGTTA